MSFDDWAKLLELRERLIPSTTAEARKPWRCTGPCQQLMYGQVWEDGNLYPSPENTPVGMFYSKEYPRVCHVCWQMIHNLENAPSGYWINLEVFTKRKVDRLGSGGNYLFT